PLTQDPSHRTPHTGPLIQDPHTVARVNSHSSQRALFLQKGAGGCSANSTGQICDAGPRAPIPLGQDTRRNRQRGLA
ncbi:Steroid 17-alpha-hydroxylase/1720 lyase, partial [Dissostichus eleginoides]